jgi:putative flippase GtrA
MKAFCKDVAASPCLRWEPLRYFLISGLAFLVDTAVFSISLRIFSLPWPLAACLGFIVGVWGAYELSIRYVFLKRKLSRSPKMELLIFVFLGVVGLSVTQLVLYFCIEWFFWPAEISKIAAAVITFLTNFFSRKVLLFK